MLYLVTCPTAGRPLFCEFSAQREIDGKYVSHSQIVSHPCQTEDAARALFEDVKHFIGVDLWAFRSFLHDPVRLASSYNNF